MVVGYSLGNKNNEEEIKVLGEDDSDVIVFSSAIAMPLTRKCRNQCNYCGYQKDDSLRVPYSTIKLTKNARLRGIREAIYISGERPDKFPSIRATLDLWGFSSYLDYVYTVCELGFLEGLIPIIEVGALSQPELRKISEITALAKIMLDSVDTPLFQKVYPLSPGKQQELRLKAILACGKINFPVISGIMVGIGETKTYRKSTLRVLAEINKKYQHIHEVVIQNFVPVPGTPWAGKTGASHSDMLEIVEFAINTLPGVKVTVPLATNPKFEDFIKVGVRDLGSICDIADIRIPGSAPTLLENIEPKIRKMGFRLQQRFPLSLSFIRDGKYSKKLGQVFDAYKYKIKKEEQEKVKDTKSHARK